MLEFFKEFHFDRPYILAIIPVLIILFTILNKKQIICTPNFFKLKTFASITNLKLLVQGNNLNDAKKINILILIFFSCIFLALAKPRWGYIEVEHYNYDKNLVVLLDSSQSMSVSDLSPSRFTRAKQEIYDILTKYPDYRIGIISFTDIPYIISPLTKDHGAIINNLKSLSPDDFKIQGSNINEALKLTINYFKKVPGTEKYILLISDGDFTTKLDSKIIQKITNQKLKLFIYATGTPLGGPVFKEGKIIEYQGQKVISKLNLSNLDDIAKKLQGKLINITHDNLDIDKFNNFITQNTELSKNNIIIKQWQERFYIFIIPAIAILLFFFTHKIFLCFAILCYLFTSNYAQANIFLNKDQKAIKYYNNKEYDKAENHFSTSYNKAVAAYRNNKFSDSIKYFDDLPVEHINAQFNKGNAYFMTQEYQQAIKSCETVLKYDQDNQKAKDNLKIAKEMLKKQSQQKNNPDKQQEQQKQQDNNQQEKENNSNNNNKDHKEQNNATQQKNKKEKLDSTTKNIDNNIFNLVETDSGTLLKKKIQNKEMQNKEKLSNNKPW